MAAKRTTHTTRNLIIAVLPLLAALICLGIGRYSLDVRETVKILFSGLTGYEPDPTGYTVIFNVRLPQDPSGNPGGCRTFLCRSRFSGTFLQSTGDSGHPWRSQRCFLWRSLRSSDARKSDPGPDSGPDLWNFILHYHLFH